MCEREEGVDESHGEFAWKEARLWVIPEIPGVFGVFSPFVELHEIWGVKGGRLNMEEACHV